MLEAIRNFFENIVVDILPGDLILQYVDQYFIQQSELNQVLMVIGMGALAAIGLISIIKGILKKTAGLIKFLLLIAIAYYVIVVVFNIDILGMIFG